METGIEVQKNGSKYEVRVSHGKSRHGSSTIYHNYLTPNAKQIAQILIDLKLVSNFPMDEAVEIYRARLRKGDWLGF